jgi:diguanylate cyclase (GGDEF)-like protein
VEQLGPRLGIGIGAVTVSIGVLSVEPTDQPGVADLLARADRAMYEAKKLGRNRIVMIDHGRQNGEAA